MKIKYIPFCLLISLLNLQCNDKEEGLPLTPSSLQFEVQQATDDSRTVTLQISSENTSFYKVYFGEGTDEPLITEDRTVSHTYGKAGMFTIRVQAHSNGVKYISETKNVNIGNADYRNGGDTDSGGIPTSGSTSPESYEGMNLVWQDEFNGEELNLEDWSFETGTGSNGWGNNELQYYRKENTSVTDGYLIITAKEEDFGGKNFTSSRIKTQGKQAFQYGRIDIRAALPQGQGIWPALWMLGSNFPTVGWPACGEIDIMEMIGGAGKDNTVHGTIHWGHAGQYATYGDSYSLDNGIFADRFHVFSIVWDASSIRWFVDDVEFNVVDITPAELSEFHQEFFLIFNVAVGGNWPGSPDTNTSFPQQMIVDYIRVFQEQ